MNKIYRLGLRIIGWINNEYFYRLLRRVCTRPLSKLIIHLNYRCNYQCRYCYVRHGYVLPQDKLLGYDDWLSLIEEARAIGVKKVSILGGEPLCEPYLEQLLKKITDAGMKAYIYTNGSLVSQDWLKKIACYRPLLIIKYDIDTPVYQYHTCQKHYSLEDVEERIRLCIAKGIRVITFTTLTRRNVDSIGIIIEKSLALGALPAFERYLPVADAATNELLDISDEQYFRAADETGKRFSNVLKEWMVAIRIAGRGCGCYSDIISISPDGSVLPCPYLPNTESTGNVWHEKLAVIRKRMISEKHLKYSLAEKCHGCEYRYSCAGGCYTYAFLKKGKYELNCTKLANIGFCSYLLADIYETADALRRPA